MTSPIVYPVDDKDLDDAALWAVIDSASAASLSSASKSHKHLGFKYNNNNNHRQSPLPISYSSPPVPKLPQNSTTRNHYSGEKKTRSIMEGEVLDGPGSHHRPQKMTRTCVSEVSETSPLAMVNHVLRTPTAPSYSSPESMRFSGKENSPIISDFSPLNCGGDQEKETTRHSLSGRFPSVTLFKEFQDAAMAILEKSDYTHISGSPYIKKSGWRKISFYFNLSYEIKDKSIEFDENRNVIRAEFVVRAYMQGGRFSDGWGSCDRREKRFMKPNHDIPSTAETRAKNKACQDLLGIGEYRPGVGRAT